MKSYKQYLKLTVRYKIPDRPRVSDEEYGEVIKQSNEFYKHPSFYKDVPDVFKKALLLFSKNKSLWKTAVKHAKIEKLLHGVTLYNSDFGMSNPELDKAKVTRVRKQLRTDAIDRPIVLRSVDKSGKSLYYLVSGNTRATIIGFGVEVFVVDL